MCFIQSMDSTIARKDIYVKDTGTERGRGVFTGQRFQEGEVVEVAPVIPMAIALEDIPPEIKTYAFNWGDLTNAPIEMHAVVLVYGSLYNHSNPANLRYDADKEASTMVFTAVRDIQIGEELTINYNAGGGSPTSESNEWFEKNEVSLIE